MKLEISPETFYMVGIASFSIIGLMAIINLVLAWRVSNFYSKSSSIASIIFDFALVLMFNYIRGMSSPQVDNLAESDDIDDIIEQLKVKKAEKGTALVLDEAKPNKRKI